MTPSMNDHPIAAIIGRLDALDVGDVRLGYVERDGSVWATLGNVDVRSEHTVCSLAGNGDSADDAVAALWKSILEIKTSDAIRIAKPDEPKRYVRWNGHAWRDVTDLYAHRSAEAV